MLRGPVQASFPSLEPFPREAGTSGHVYPFPARSASPAAPHSDLRLPSSMASATFWRSPYSEALRQSKSSVVKKPEGVPHKDSFRPSLTAPADEKEEGRGGEKAVEPAVVKSAAAAKTGASDGRDSGSDTSSDHVRQIRGILCKSSLSSNSRQSAGKVQKRVKFDDSVDKVSGGQSPRQVSSVGSSPTSARPPLLPRHHRSASASVTLRAPVRMPSLRHGGGGERLQSVDKTGVSHGLSLHPQSPAAAVLNPHQHPHVPRPQSGPLIRTSSVPDLTLPRPTPRNGGHQSYQLLHSPHSQHSPTSLGPGNSSSRLSPTALEFKIYRQLPGPITGPSPRSSDTSPPQARARYFATPGYGTGSRALVRLSRSLTSPAIPLHQRPFKQLAQSASSGEDQPQTPNSSWVGVYQEVGHKHVAGQDTQVAMDDDKDEDRRGSFLDDDKTVQILHWLKEVDHRQAREGRCPVFVNGPYREG